MSYDSEMLETIKKQLATNRAYSDLAKDTVLWNERNLRTGDKVMPLPTDIDTTPNPIGTSNLIEAAQNLVGSIRSKFRDTLPEFWALGVAFEALRFSWYVAVHDDITSAEKLDLLKAAIADYERIISK